MKFFSFKCPFTFSPDPFRLNCLPAEEKNHELSLVLDRICCLDVDVSTIWGLYGLSTRISVWAGTSGSPG